MLLTRSNSPRLSDREPQKVTKIVHETLLRGGGGVVCRHQTCKWWQGCGVSILKSGGSGGVVCVNIKLVGGGGGGVVC